MKKIIKSSIVFIVTFTFLSLFGQSIFWVLADNVQHRICTGTFCINKPKGWHPMLVRRDDKNYFYNLINIRYLPFLPQDYPFPKSKNGILLGKSTHFIHIEKLNHKDTNTSWMKKITIDGHKCYQIGKTDPIIVCPDDEMLIVTDDINTSVITQLFNNKN